jgi:hypothetical protein
MYHFYLILLYNATKKAEYSPIRCSNVDKSYTFDSTIDGDIVEETLHQRASQPHQFPSASLHVSLQTRQ